MKRCIVISTLILCYSIGIKAQRHYGGVAAVEWNYGLNTFGRHNTYLNFSISKYKSRTAYWKGGISFLETSYVYNVQNDYSIFCKTGRSYFADANYFITLATNRTSLYVNGGVGAYIGAETYVNPESMSQFICGPKLAVDTELFVVQRVALIGGLNQYWNPFSDLKQKWRTIWNVGVKVLIY